MALVSLITNPFEPLKDIANHIVKDGLSIRQTLRDIFGAEFVEFKRPTMLVLNGKPLMRKDWEDTLLKSSDKVQLVALPQGFDPITWLYILYVVLVVAAVVVASNVDKTVPQGVQQNSQGADAVFNLRGQRNQIRLGEPIESAYGRTRLWPSYAAAPFNRYVDNDQYLYALFCLGQGEYDVELPQIEDTPFSNFQDVTYNILQPGEKPSMFPTNVVTSSEISNIELYAPNEPESGVSWIVDVPYDDNGTPDDPSDDTAEEGHYEWAPVGPFVMNPAGTEIDSIECDFAFPQGNYRQTTNGGLEAVTAAAVVEAQKIDDSGAPVGDWFTLMDGDFTTWHFASTTPQRFTKAANVPLGRYQIRIHREYDRDTSIRVQNRLFLESARAFIPSEHDFGNVTLMEFKARATNNLNDNSQNRVNVWATRKLPLYDVETGEWTALPQATRSPIAAICDIFRAQYGGRYSDELLALDSLWGQLFDDLTAETILFDWIFDQPVTCWDAAQLVARVCRGTIMPVGSKIDLIREVPKTLPTAIFNQSNVVAGSVKIEYKLASIDDYDGYLVEYSDPDTGKPETVLCVLDDEDGDHPEPLKIAGISDRQRAWELGMFFRKQKRYRKTNISFKTGREGILPGFGALIGLVNDVVRWGQGGIVKSITGDGSAGSILHLSEPVLFGIGSHFVCLRNRRAEPSALIPVTAGADQFKIVLGGAIVLSDYPIQSDREKPLFAFGPAASIFRKLIVTGYEPSAEEEVSIQCVEYDDRLFSDAGGTPPPQGNTGGSNPDRPQVPEVDGLNVTKSPNVAMEVIASWRIAAGATHYVVQLSYDGIRYDTLAADVTDTSFRFTVLPKFIYVRVCAVNVGAGPWDYWTGIAPVEGSNIDTDNLETPNPATGFVGVAGIEYAKVSWEYSTNTSMLGAHIYESRNTTRPVSPSYFWPFPTDRFFRNDMKGDDETLYFWVELEGRNRRKSSIVGPLMVSSEPFPTVEDIELELDEILADIAELNAALLTKNTRGPTAPSSPNLNDIWWDTANSNRPKIWNGSAWIDSTDTRLTSLVTQVNDPTTGLPATRAEVFSGATTWAAADAAISATIDVVEAEVDTAQATANAAITNAATAQTTADAAQSTATSAVTAASNAQADADAAQTTANTAVTNAATAQTTADGAASAASIAQTTANSAQTAANGAQTTANTAVTNAATAQTTANGAASAASAANTAASTAQTTADGAQTTADAAVTAAATAQTDADTALAQYVLDVVATIGDDTVSAGIRIAAGGGSSRMILQADRFAIINGTSGATIEQPFVVVGGVVYINTAMIRTATITNAMIANLEAGKLTAGTITATVSLAAAKMSTVGTRYNVANPANEMPFTAYSFSNLTDLHGVIDDSDVPDDPSVLIVTDASNLTFSGWAVGSGFSLKRFGQSQVCFSVAMSGNASVPFGRLAWDLVYRKNGGSWVYFSDHQAGEGNYVNVTLSQLCVLSGLVGTDTIEFAISLTKDAGSSLAIGSLTINVVTFNG